MGRTGRKRKRKCDLYKCQISDGCKLMDINKISQQLGSIGWENVARLIPRDFKETGRGLCSKIAIGKGDLLIQLPFDCLISLKTLEDDNVFKQLFENSSETFHFQVLLAFFILCKKHLHDADYQYYIETIPKDFQNPLFCSKAELYCLPENLLLKVVEQNEKIKVGFASLQSTLTSSSCPCCKKSFLPELITLEEFKWAYMAVNSRCVFVDPQKISSLIENTGGSLKKLLKDQPNLALAPFLDLLNHSDKARTIATLTNSMIYEIKTNVAYKPYEQTFISYGNLTNCKLLTEYGFFIHKNQHDLFEINLNDIEQFLKLHKDFKTKIIHRNKFKFIRDHCLNDQMFISETDGLSHNFVVVLYLLFVEESHFPNILNQTAFGDFSGYEISVKTIARELLEFKITEYQNYVLDLEKLSNLTDSGFITVGYLKECLRILNICLNKLF